MFIPKPQLVDFDTPEEYSEVLADEDTELADDDNLSIFQEQKLQEFDQDKAGLILQDSAVVQHQEPSIVADPIINSQHSQQSLQPSQLKKAHDAFGKYVQAHGTKPKGPQGKYLDFYHPSCPPHPTMEEPKIPYGFIPFQARKEAKYVCQSTAQGSSKVKLYPGKVIQLENVVLDFNFRQYPGAYSVLSRGFLKVFGCQPQQDIKIDYVTKSVEYIDRPLSNEEYDSVIVEDTVVHGRDDCGNVWHALADFLRSFNGALTVDGPESLPTERKMLLLDDRLQISDDPDNLSQCPYEGAYDAIARKGVMRGKELQGLRLMFKRLIIPADQDNQLGLIWSMSSCSTGDLIGQYVNNLFDYFQLGTLNAVLQDPLNAKKISSEQVEITVSSRRKKPFAPGVQIGRVITNEADLVAALEQLPNVKVNVAEFYELSFRDQINLMRRTDILIGMHGAGLTNLIYTALDGYVIELIPYTWRSGEFKTLSLITGRNYLFWQNQNKENHIEPHCYELQNRNSASEPNVCRTGTSSTIADVPEIIKVAKQAVDGLRQSRGWKVNV